MTVIDRGGKRGRERPFEVNGKWAQPAVRVYRNGPQNEKERQWRLNRKEFIRSVIRKEG